MPGELFQSAQPSNWPNPSRLPWWYYLWGGRARVGGVTFPIKSSMQETTTMANMPDIWKPVYGPLRPFMNTISWYHTWNFQESLVGTTGSPFYRWGNRALRDQEICVKSQGWTSVFQFLNSSSSYSIPLLQQIGLDQRFKENKIWTTQREKMGLLFVSWKLDTFEKIIKNLKPFLDWTNPELWS